jgi:chromosome segregation and condensation protein ScpB
MNKANLIINIIDELVETGVVEEDDALNTMRSLDLLTVGELTAKYLGLSDTSDLPVNEEYKAKVEKLLYRFTKISADSLYPGEK